jgi:serine/threonine-protein phosphatase 2A regulatory subunit B'
MTLRSHIRKVISHIFYRFVFETERHAGTGELLEILGSIINGFALPLKPEHVQFLHKALMPLHRPRNVAAYLQQLIYCVSQFVQKDPSTVTFVITGLCKNWPWSSSAKQIVLLNELEEVLELSGHEAAAPALKPFFYMLARCVAAPHFQVAERALFLWRSEALASGVLGKPHVALALPALYAALSKQAAGHWNPTVETLAGSVLAHYQKCDPALFDKCAADFAAAAREGSAERPLLRPILEPARRDRWKAIEAAAAAAAAAAPRRT